MAEPSMREKTCTLTKTRSLLTAMNPTSMDNAPIANDLPKKQEGCEAWLQALSPEDFRGPAGKPVIDLSTDLEQGCSQRRSKHRCRQRPRTQHENHRSGGNKGQGLLASRENKDRV